MRKPQVKAGTSLAAAADRRKAFIEAYLTNGRNATQAAIKAGYSARTAGAAASRLLKDVNISKAVTVRVEKAQQAMELNTDNVLREVARIALFDPATLYDENGKLLAIPDMPADTRAAIASIDIEQLTADGKTIGTTNKLKLWDKNAAIEKAMRHLGLFEKDNRQRPPVHVTISLAG